EILRAEETASVENIFLREHHDAARERGDDAHHDHGASWDRKWTTEEIAREDGADEETCVKPAVFSSCAREKDPEPRDAASSAPESREHDAHADRDENFVVRISDAREHLAAERKRDGRERDGDGAFEGATLIFRDEQRRRDRQRGVNYALK